jgi:hypothetical protein
MFAGVAENALRWRSRYSSGQKGLRHVFHARQDGLGPVGWIQLGWIFRQPNFVPKEWVQLALIRKGAQSLHGRAAAQNLARTNAYEPQ